MLLERIFSGVEECSSSEKRRGKELYGVSNISLLAPGSKLDGPDPEAEDRARCHSRHTLMQAKR
jgi:hypothetical protein